MTDARFGRHARAVAVFFAVEVVALFAILLSIGWLEDADARAVLSIYVPSILLCQAVLLAPVAWRPRPSGRSRSVVASLVVGSLFVTLLIAALLGLVHGVAYGLGVDWPPEYEGEVPLEFVGLAALAVCWGLVAVLLLRWARRSPRDDASLVGRTSAALFAGSLIEGVASIPIYAMVRRRSDCTCGQPAFWAVIAVITVALFALGPSVLLAWLLRRGRRGRRAAPSAADPATGTPSAGP